MDLLLQLDFLKGICCLAGVWSSSAPFTVLPWRCCGHMCDFWRATWATCLPLFFSCYANLAKSSCSSLVFEYFELHINGHGMPDSFYGMNNNFFIVHAIKLVFDHRSLWKYWLCFHCYLISISVNVLPSPWSCPPPEQVVSPQPQWRVGKEWSRQRESMNGNKEERIKSKQKCYA